MIEQPEKLMIQERVKQLIEDAKKEATTTSEKNFNFWYKEWGDVHHNLNANSEIFKSQWNLSNDAQKELLAKGWLIYQSFLSVIEKTSTPTIFLPFATRKS